MEKPRKIKIFDTTLRDGEQSPGATMTHQEKLMVAGQLAKLGVDVIEAGFPIASDDDFRAVKEIAETVKGPTIAGLARALEKDVKCVWEAVQGAKKPRIHTFMSSSDIHLQSQFKISRQQALKMSVDAVKLAKSLCDDVEFSPMDASRSDPEFLNQMVEATIDAGATTVNIPDTVGYAQPTEFGALIANIRKKIQNIDDAIISVHCHNDLGLAVANSLEAVRNGAGQVECTINGLGERAGNASLEEIVMALRTRQQFYKAFTEINFKEIFNASQMVQNFTGIKVQRNKAIVGENAFAHESGIHQHGLIADKSTFEIMKPEMIGKRTELVLGKHSGKHATKVVLGEMGFRLSEEQQLAVLQRIKALADKQKKVSREDIVAIAMDVTKQLPKREQKIRLEEFSVTTGNKAKPTASVRLVVEGKAFEGKGVGVGPVDALSKAIQSVLPFKIKLKEYNLKAITGGTDALADVVIQVEDERGNVFDAEAVNEDVIVASANALILGCNLALESAERKRK